MNDELQEILNRKFTELDNFIVTFEAGAIKPAATVKAKPQAEAQPTAEAQPKVEAQPSPTPSVSKSVEAKPTPVISKPAKPAKPMDTGSEYDIDEPLPSIKAEAKSAPAIKVSTTNLITDAKVAFVFSAILEHYDDIWISKKPDGSFAVEQMDGHICQFSIKGSKLNFTANSFSGVDPKIKTAIQKKFIELSKIIV
jgi:hypothetical protein